MRNNINIKGNNQIFTYIIEYQKGNSYTDNQDIYWSKCNKERKCIHLFEGDVEYFRHKNDWYSIDTLQKNVNYISNHVNTSKIRIYIPNHSISTYAKGIQYCVNLNTWINGYKIDLGSFIFKPTDCLANEFGLLKNGNNEYSEYIEFNIIDPFYLTYSDYWIDFRHNICREPLNINSTGSLLNVSLYVIDKYEDRYLMNSEYSGGATSFNISKETDYLTLDLSESYDPYGLQFKLDINSEYSGILSYLYETYGITTSLNNIGFELIIKNKDYISVCTIKEKDGQIINDPIGYDAVENNGFTIQKISVSNLKSRYSVIRDFFKSWNNFEEGWNFVASLIVYDDHGEEIFNIISNELPVNQEIFSRFTNDSEKLIDINDMNITNYIVVNKIKNEIVQIERPNDSKDNILQPVFFRVKDTEKLTLHPEVTENICINLDDYKSKVDKFIFQIIIKDEVFRFNQIGANKYGILFNIPGNKLPKEALSGTYYILNENYELVTTGKYNCVR